MYTLIEGRAYRYEHLCLSRQQNCNHIINWQYHHLTSEDTDTTPHSSYDFATNSHPQEDSPGIDSTWYVHRIVSLLTETSNVLIALPSSGVVLGYAAPSVWKYLERSKLGSIADFDAFPYSVAIGAAFYSMGRKLVVDKQLRLTRSNRDHAHKGPDR